MATKPTDAEQARLLRQVGEVIRRHNSGELPAQEVHRAMQNIVEGRLGPVLPPETAAHLALAESVWRLNLEMELGFTGMPPTPIQWAAAWTNGPTRLVFPMLYLPDAEGKPGLHRTYEMLWDLIPDSSYDNSKRREELWDPTDKVTRKTLRQTRGHRWRPGIRWVALSLNEHRHKSPQQAVRFSKEWSVQLAGVEVLMAAVLFPELLMSKKKLVQLNMSGLQLNFSPMGGWTSVPALMLDAREPRQRPNDPSLLLKPQSADMGSDDIDFFTPTVVEC